MRQTLSFPKKLSNHIGAIWDFVHHYNAHYNFEHYYAGLPSWFHGYSGQHMYLPMLIHEASSEYPLGLQRRAGNRHAGKGVAGLLRWLFWRLQRALPGVRILLRADAGFA